MKKIILSILILLPIFLSAQYINRDGYTIWQGRMSVGKPNTTAAPIGAWLEVGKDSTTKGLLLPRVVNTSAVTTPARGMMVYSIDDSSVYTYTGSSWVVAGGSLGWKLTGNAGTIAGTNFVGTTDAQDVVFKRNSNEALRLENRQANTSNIYLNGGWNDSSGIIYKDHPGLGKTPFIHQFQKSGTDGDNTFFGLDAGNRTMTGSTGVQGSYNLGVGTSVLKNNTTGYRNTGVGTYTMQNNTTGINNTAVGQNALATNTTGYNNAVLGGRAAAFGSPHDVSAVGLDAASRTNNAAYIAALGTDALYNAYNSMYAVAVGDSTLWKDSVGVKNTAVGSRAGYYLGDTYPNFSTQKDNYMTFLGADASRDSSVYHQTGLENSTAIGYNAKVFASNQMSFGNENITTNLFRGKIGIGTISPDSTIHIVGGFKYANGSQGAGKVLTSDANGGASWSTSSIPNLQQVLTAGSTLTSDHTVIHNGYLFQFYAENGSKQQLIKSSTDSTLGMYLRNSSSNDLGYFTLNGSDTSARIKGGRATHGSALVLSDAGTINTPYLGLYYIDTLTNNVGTKAIRYNPATGLISYADTTTSGGSQNLQSVTSLGNATTNDIQFDDGAVDYTIIGTTAGNGYFKFRSSTSANNAIIANNNLSADRTYTLPNSSGTFPLGTGTSNEIAYWSGANTLGSLATATYPSLTELSYVKGVTSSIQTQLNGKQASGSYAVTTNNLSDLANAGTARTNLGATSIGSNIFTSTNPSAITFLRGNADNTVDWLTASSFRTAIGAGTGSGDLLSTNNLSDVANAGTARTNLGLAIGTNVQAYDADLTTWAGITPSANIQSFNGAASYSAARVLLLPSLTGNTLKTLRVNAGETDVEWAAAGGGDMLAANNLSDVASATTSRNNILPSKTGNSLKYLRVNAGETDYELATVSGSGDMILASVQSVTGLKTFDKDKIATKGTSTGITTISTANTSATDYTFTLPAVNVTAAQLTYLTTATSAATASTLMLRDANANVSVNNIVDAYTSTATAAGTTTLTVSSDFYQNFSGTSTQTVVLPDATTLTNGHQFFIMDNSTGNLTVNMNGGTLLKTVPANQYIVATLTNNGTAAGTWTVQSSVPQTEFIRQSATYTLTSTTNIQKLFNASTNGALTVKAGTTYTFEGVININTMSATSGNMKFDVLGAGTATLTSAGWAAVGLDNTTIGTAAANGGSYTATNVSSGNIITAGTGTAVFARIKGTVTINAGGTLIPSIGLTTANAAVVGVNTWMSFTEVLPASTNYTSGWN